MSGDIVVFGRASKASATRLAGWMKAGPNSAQAHRIKTAGSRLLTTACGVALLRSLAAEASTSTMRCFECQELERGGLPAEPLPDHSAKPGYNRKYRPEGTMKK